MRSSIAAGRSHEVNARSQPELLLDTAQRKHAGVQRQLAAIESNAQLLARNRWKFKWRQAIFAHDGCGAPQSIRESVLQPAILDRMAAFRYIRHSILQLA